MQLASMGQRAIALIIDAVLVLIAELVVTVLSLGILTPLVVVAWFVYFIVMEQIQGATFGKQLMGIKVVKEDGSPLDWGTSLIRNILRIVDGLLLYLVGFIFAQLSDKKQRLGDRAAKTIVIVAPKGASPVVAP